MPLQWAFPAVLFKEHRFWFPLLSAPQANAEELWKRGALEEGGLCNGGWQRLPCGQPSERPHFLCFHKVGGGVAECSESNFFAHAARPCSAPAVVTCRSKANRVATRKIHPGSFFAACEQGQMKCTSALGTVALLVIMLCAFA